MMSRKVHWFGDRIGESLWGGSPYFDVSRGEKYDRNENTDYWR